MTRVSRRRLLTAPLLALPALRPASAQGRAIRLVTGVAAGASLDTLARNLAKGMTDQLGTSVVVENVPAGGGLAATLQVARAPADGTVLLMATDSLVLVEAALPDPGYSARRSFAPVSQAIRAAQLFATHPESGFATIQEYVARLRTRPGSVNLGLPTWGGIAHVASALLNRQLGGLQVEYIPYRGGAPATVDLLAKRLDAVVITLPAVTEHVRQGRIVPLAVTPVQRDAAMPQVPTLAETVAPGFDVASWQGVVAPAGTPAATVERLHGAIANALATPEIRDRLIDLGFTIVASAPDAFARHIERQAETLGAAVREAGIQPGA